MQATVTRGILEVDGADIYYERRGEGPALLLIAGGGGDGTAYGHVADMLARDHTVLTYHRRGASPRSPLRGPRRQFSVLRQAADAAALITANGFTSASVFGSSSGALIALETVAAYPALVDRAIAHEPPIITALPDRGEFLDWYDHLYAVSLQGRPEQAMAEFFERLELDIPGQETAGGAEVPETAVRARRSALERFMLEEMPVFTYYRPDYAQLSMPDTPLLLAAGSDSLNLHGPGKPVFYARAAQRVAEITGKKLVEFPGNHLSYQAIPQDFVDTLRSILPVTETAV